MTTSTNNPQVAALLEQIRTSYEKLLSLIDGPLATLELDQLYQQPFDDEWTVMENLAHTAEFLPYWLDQFSKVIAEPGRSFGRTAEDEGRIAAIRDHRHEALSKMRADLEKSFAHMESVLSSFTDSDLEVTGQHPKYGQVP